MNVYVVDAEGIVRCGTDASSSGLFIADRTHVRAALRTNGFVTGEYIVGRVLRKTALPFGLPDGPCGRRPSA